MFFSGYSALVGDNKGSRDQNAEETIDKLVDQVSTCTLLEDRRAAVQGLRGLARDWKLPVGTKGMPVFVKTLITDKMDAEIVKVSLEALNILCTPDDDDRSLRNKSEDLGVMFTEIYTKDPSNVSLLLEILEEPDFYVRFNSIQLLSTLLNNNPSAVQDCVLSSPMGISRLIDMLDDKREIIRNEGLLLLISLTKSNAEIQKIVAFENAFERVLNIVEEEGSTDGDIIVQDCFQLIHNLLRYNISNQNMFREASCMRKIPILFGNFPDDPSAWVKQKVDNTLALLELIRILVGSKNPNSTVNQNALHNAKVLDKLVSMAFEYPLPSRIRIDTFYTLGETIKGNPKSVDMIFKALVHPRPGAPKISAILYMVQLALKSDDFGLRVSAVYMFECFVHLNPDAQIGLAATLFPPPSNNPNDQQAEIPESPGSLIISSMLEWETSRKDPYQVWFASVMLSHILNGNKQAKLMVLTQKLEDSDVESISLLHKCIFTAMTAHSKGADVRVILGILCFIAIWLYDCPEAVQEFLGEGSNVQFLVEQISQSTGVQALVQGVAALILGLCYEFNEDHEPAFTKASIQALIVNRIRLDVFESRLDRLQESKEFRDVLVVYTTPVASSPAKATPEIYFEHSFVEFFKKAQERVSQSISQKGNPAEQSQQDKELQNYRRKIHELENKIEQVKSQHASEVRDLNQRASKLIEEHESTLSQHSIQVQELNSRLSKLNEEHERAVSEFKDLEREHEDLLVCLADQDLEIQTLKGRLRAHGEFIPEDDDEEDGELSETEEVQ